MYRIHFTPEEIELGFLKQIEHHLKVTFTDVHNVGGKGKSLPSTEVRTHAATLAHTIQDLLTNLRMTFKTKKAKQKKQEITNNVNNSRTTLAS